jgi:hypothetical protein
VAEVAYKRGGDDTKAIGDGGVEVAKFDQQGQDAGVDQRDPAIDQIASKIFLPAIAMSLKNNILVAQEGVGNGEDIGRYDENEIVDARIQKIVQSSVDKSAKHGIPSAHGKIPQRLVSRLAEKS